MSGTVTPIRKPGNVIKVVEALKRLHSDLAELNGGNPPQWVDVTCKQHIAAAEQRAAEDPTQRALRDAALAQLATWCESSAPETEGVICTARAGVYLMCAAEARRLAAGPLPKVVHAQETVDGYNFDGAGVINALSCGEGVLLIPPGEDAP